MARATDVTLLAGRLSLQLSPSIGGSISAFEWIDGDDRRPILRKCNTELERALDAGSFPLVPYVNRIRGGEFSFRGRAVHLAPNMAGDPSPLHGQGWLGAWSVDRHDERSASLSFRHEAGEWPWSYDALQQFLLDERGLTVSLGCRNTSREPMPCGLGQHPYFPCGAETRIETVVMQVWTIDEQVLPVEKIPAAGRFDLSSRPVCGQDLDHGFAGWDGRAVLGDPAWPFEIAIGSPTARFFQLYSPAAGDICVAEPVTHANAALNAPEQEWPELGMEILQPGADMSLEMRLEVTASA